MATYTTYHFAGNREDLLELIVNITPTETPMFSGFAKTVAKATTHEWMQDTLRAAAMNNVIEGSDATEEALGARTRVSNFCQLTRGSWKVSKTQEVVDKVGVTSEYQYQLEKAMKNIARDCEYALINGTGNSGTSAAAREIKSIITFITTNVTAAGGSVQLTETLYNDNLQLIFNAGGNPNITYVGGYNKRKISGFTASVRRNIEASNKKLIASIEIYESDFGMQTLMISRFVTATTVLMLERDKWRIAMLRPVEATELAPLGSARKGMVEAEWTLEALHEGSSGIITGLASAA